MDKLITVTPVDDVTDDYKKEAKAWIVWDSKNRKRFPYNYTQEERILILSGGATITPNKDDDEDDAPEPIKLVAGNAVIFHKGFKCQWQITKRMKKHYAVFAVEGEEDEEAGAAITCDVCGEDCVAESYFVKKEELDICLACYEKDKKKYKKAEHQKNGEKWVEPTAAADEEEEGPKKKKRK
jgi:uncharacterized cupin superfamily protein